MNLTVPNTPPVAERVRSVLEGRTLVAGRQFYSAADGVVVSIAPLPAEEIVAEGSDHEITVSTGFPPDPATAGMTLWVQRRRETGGQLERLGETDRFGALLFSPGSDGTEYQLTVTRGATVRLDSEDTAILPFTVANGEADVAAVCDPGPASQRPATTPKANPCPICRIAAEDWTAKLNGLRDALQCGTPICRSHLHGAGNLVLAAAREGWQQKITGVFGVVAKLLGDLLDEPGGVRKGFLQQYPGELGNQALNQAAGVLSTAIAVGHTLAKNPARAAAAAHAAAVHLQSAVGTDRTRREHFASRLAAVPGHPLDGLWSRLAVQLRGEWSQGFLAFRLLSSAITQPSPEQTERAVAVRGVLTDRERGTLLLTKLEFIPVADGSGEVSVDVAPLGFRVLDQHLLRSLETAWRAIQPTFSRNNPGVGVCVRVTLEADDSHAQAIQGTSAGLAVACGLLALARGEALDEKTAIIGELLSGPATELGSFAAAWPSRVADKLEAARAMGCERVIVGVLEEGVRHPGHLDRAARPGFDVASARTVGEALGLVRPKEWRREASFGTGGE